MNIETGKTARLSAQTVECADAGGAAGASVRGRWGAVVVAAGRGSRMGTAESKQFLPLAGRPILVHSLQLFQGMDEIAEIVLVTGSADLERCRALADRFGLSKLSAVVAGGSERQHSVRRGLDALGTEWALVHDGVRPLVTPETVRACCAKAEETGGAVLAVPVKDTIKQVGSGGIIVSTPDRRSLWAIQTPQAFRRSLLLEAHARAEADGYVGTDDASLVERLGVPVAVAQGDYTNIKITTPDDLPYAEFLLSRRR